MTPTQEDREAAKRWSNALPVEQCRHLLTLMVAAEERGARMALEAAAKVAKEYSTLEILNEDDATHNFACSNIATAIRQIDPASLGAGR